MSRLGRRVAAVLVAGAAMLGIAALSRAPYAPSGGEEAVLRLSWRARGERVQECRQLSERELAELPIHMRRSEVCEGRVLPYVLHVELDGRTLAVDTIRAAGAREDRPLYVYREMVVAPGVHELSVRFVREDQGEQVDAPSGRRGRVMDMSLTPLRLELASTMRFRAGEVVLVTYDPDRRDLVTRVAEPGSDDSRD